MMTFVNNVLITVKSLASFVCVCVCVCVYIKTNRNIYLGIYTYFYFFVLSYIITRNLSRGTWEQICRHLFAL